MAQAPEGLAPQVSGMQSQDPVDGVDRRNFLEQVTLGAVTLAAASIAAAVPARAAHASPPPASARIPTAGSAPFSDAWLARITGKHKQFFDAVETNDGFALVFAMAFLNLNHDTYNLSDKDLTAVVGLRHFAMPMALPDAMWARYKIGEGMKVTDPVTKAPAIRNPFLHADGVPFPGAAIPTLVGRGVIFTVCNVALTVISGKMAANAGVTADVAKKEWTDGLVPGMTLVPVGVMAVNLAQEHGCTYCYGG
jgi:intracellular sulfur oxidation DsrE/DsrF family protein